MMNNFYERFQQAVRRFPEHTAIEVQRAEKGGAKNGVERFTYAELNRLAESCAGFLRGRGIAAGDRCAILADNDAHWCAAYVGILRLGAVAVPLDTNYRSKQVAALLGNSGTKIIFTTPRYLAAVQGGVAATGSAAEIVLLHGRADGLADFDVVRQSSPEGLPACPAVPESPAVMLYTSGTTSDPKGVVLTHANLLAEAEAVFRVVHVDEHDCILGVLPLFHALAQMANLLLPFTVGARVVYLEQVNTTELLRALEQRGVTIFACVPQFFYLIHQRVHQQLAKAGWFRRALFRSLLALNRALRRGPGWNIGRGVFGRVHRVLGPRMRLLVTGGSRFDPEIGGQLYDMGFNILQAYGLTECSGGATVLREGDPHVGSVGQPLPGVEVRILPAEAEADGERRDGEVAIRGPIVMQGYYNRPDVNAEVLRDAWLHTGDLGYLDAAGRLYITGRKKEVIVLSSGKNIYPEEIEEHYAQSPYIREMCVMGLERAGEPSVERLHAVVVPDFDVMRERKVVNTREIIRFEIEGLSIQVPSHKRVLSYEVWSEELPRTTTRKLKRFEIERKVLRQRAVVEEPVEEKPASDEEAAWAEQPDVARALAVVREAARETIGDRPIRPGANIELELGLDSMERVELLTRLEQVFGTQVPDEVSQKIYTVRELVDAVLAGEGAGTASGAAVPADPWSQLLAETPVDEPVLAELRRSKPLLAAVMFLKVRFLYLLARLLWRVRVTGLEHLPRQGPFLLCPNHQSYLDPFILVSALPYRVFRRLFFVGASEYFATPFRAWLARKLNLAPVDPDTNLVRAMQVGAYGLRQGKALILFPEGERSIDGDIKKFKKGAAILSLHLRAPVVPVALDGIFELWPRGRGLRWRALLPGNGHRVALRIGPALPPPEPLPAGVSLPDAEARYAAGTASLRAAVAELSTSLRSQA